MRDCEIAVPTPFGARDLQVWGDLVRGIGCDDRVRGIPVTVLISQFSTCIFAMIRFVIFVIYKTVKVVDATNCSCIIYGHGVSLGIIARLFYCGIENCSIVGLGKVRGIWCDDRVQGIFWDLIVVRYLSHAIVERGFGLVRGIWNTRHERKHRELV